MNVLILGSGGREHAIAWKISKSQDLTNLYVAPGNAGTSDVAQNVDVSATDFEQVKAFVLQKEIGLVVVGPEQPLVDGIVDYFGKDPDLINTLILGPSARASLLEGSKDFAKNFMKKYNVPTAAYQSFSRDQLEQAKAFLRQLKPPYVLKADGLAAGKGVLIANDFEQAEKALTDMLVDEKFGVASEVVVIEEFLDGMECSVFAITDGTDYKILPVAKDYKRIGEGDTGLNTGGMGCVSPVPFVDEGFMQKVESKIIKPTIKGIQMENLKFNGFLFLGLMNVDGEPYVIEYNIRLGDPEAQVILPRVKSDFLELCLGAAKNELASTSIEINDEYALSVIAASGGYPEKYEKQKQISGLDEELGAMIFQAGTTKDNRNITITSGGRVLAVTAMAENIKQAREKAYHALEKIHFEKIYYRKDIGKDLLE
mgnify:CR=1 FL=1